MLSDCGLDNFFDSKAQNILVYQGIETVDDPFEKNVTETFLNPLSVKALVMDLNATQANYKMPGINISKAKNLYIDKRYRSLIENSQKFELKNSIGVTENYQGWRVNGKMQIREEGNYLQVYIYSDNN